MEGFFWTLAAAAIAGLAWVAYNHPAEFSAISTPLTFLLMAALYCLIAYDFGVKHSSYALSDAFDASVSAEMREKIRTAVKHNEIDGRWVAILALGGLYLQFLRWLPSLGVVASNRKK